MEFSNAPDTWVFFNALRLNMLGFTYEFTWASPMRPGQKHCGELHTNLGEYPQWARVKNRLGNYIVICMSFFKALGA